MSLSLLVLHWMNRRRLIIFIFWYSLCMLLGMAYYSHVHVRWKDNSHLVHIYGAIFLPTPPSPKHFLKVPEQNVTVDEVESQTARIKSASGDLHVASSRRTKYGILGELNFNLSQFLAWERSVRVRNMTQVENMTQSLQHQTKKTVLGVGRSKTNTSRRRRHLFKRSASIMLKPSGIVSKLVTGNITKLSRYVSKLSVNLSKPLGNLSKPLGILSKPSGNSSKPSGNSSKPSGNSSKPLGKFSKPLGNLSKPSGNLSKPLGNLSKPWRNLSKPWGNLSKPSDNMSKITEVTKSLSPGNHVQNSSFLIAAIELNMHKIQEETELSFRRLVELNKIIGARNGSFVHKDYKRSVKRLHPRRSHSKQLGPRSSPLGNGSLGERKPRRLIPNRDYRMVRDPDSGLPVERQPQGETGMAPSITRAMAHSINTTQPSAISVPEIEGYYLLETKTKLRLRCKSCAVVSSSGQLVNKSAGAEIDSYPCVIRMNSAPVSGYEDDVGSRTTARVMGHVNLLKLNQSLADQEQMFTNNATRSERLIIPWLFNTRVDKKRDKYYSIAKNFSKVYTGTQFYMLSSSKMALAESLFQTDTGISRKDAKTWLSTGWMTLLFALDTCDHTDVFGLAPEKYCSEHPNDTTPYHYYEADGKRECEYYMQSETHLTSGHVFVTEKAIFARWALKSDKLSFRHPTWNLTASSNASVPLDTPFVKIYKEALRNRTLRGSPAGRRHHAVNQHIRKPAPHAVGPKTREDVDRERYQRFTHAVMFIVAVFLSLVVFLLLFLLASLFVFCFYL